MAVPPDATTLCKQTAHAEGWTCTAVIWRTSAGALGTLLTAGQVGGSGCTCVTEGHASPRALVRAVESVIDDGLMPGLPAGLAKRSFARAWSQAETTLGAFPGASPGELSRGSPREFPGG